MGGPAHHVSILSGGLDPERFETILACGEVQDGEESLEPLARLRGARVLKVQGLGRSIRPLDDVRALRTLTSIVRSYRPDIVHTHTAKAGVLGRAASLARSPRPLVLHTYHGHVLEGYFNPPVTTAFRLLERTMGHLSDKLIGVSEATVRDLVRLKVAPAIEVRCRSSRSRPRVPSSTSTQARANALGPRSACVTTKS